MRVQLLNVVLFDLHLNLGGKEERTTLRVPQWFLPLSLSLLCFHPPGGLAYILVSALLVSLVSWDPYFARRNLLPSEKGFPCS